MELMIRVCFVLVNFESFPILFEMSLVSESNKFGLETLIFPSDSEGNVTDWIEVGGSRGVALHEVLANFEGELF